MKTMLSVLFSIAAATAAQAHESLVPHHHPHGISMLPDLAAIAAGAAVLAAALIVWLNFRRS